MSAGYLRMPSGALAVDPIPAPRHHRAMTQSFVQILTRHPIPHNAAAGQDCLSQLAEVPVEARALIRGTAGCSPYLRDLMMREADWLRPALTGDPGAVFTGILDALDGVAVDHLGTALRQAKRRAALWTALCDLGGVWTLMKVTGALTALADRAVDLSIKALVAEEIRRGKLPGASPEDAATGAGMVALAMGKMGAGELNYSSDIDLICLFDQDRYGADWQEARAAFIRVTRKMTAMLSDITAGGYVFRTDLRLRPDASVMPVCLSMHSAFAYYESEGRTWERAAYIKARPCGGDLTAGGRFLQSLTPFVWRKHLDFAAIQDAHDMRLRIREHRGLNRAVTVEGHNMKLGQGGIREIEFFAQTRQLIAGGRDPGLRDRTTLGALAALAGKGWVPPEVAAELSDLYVRHRELEHRIQMVGDAQTHDMPVTAEGVARIAAFCGEDEASFRIGLLDRIARVDRLTDGFFAPAETEDGPDLSEHAKGVVEGWNSYPCLRTDRAQGIFRRLRPGLLKRLQAAANPDEALMALDGFLSGLPSGVQIFSLFEANPPLVDLIVDIAATTPTLARYLARNASVLDGVIGGSFFAPWPGVAGLTQELTARLAAAGDYERQLDAARRWHKEWHFRVGVHHLRGIIDGFEAGKQYADLAEAVVAGLWPVVQGDFAQRHGAAPGQGAVLLGMGSLGAGRLNAGSDLDLILIYDAAGVEVSGGPRPLATKAYYARLTQAMVTGLSAQTAEGRLYEVDVRLRPSGRQGPVATSVEAWTQYQEDEAWTWEHLALTRARVMAGNSALAARIEDTRRRILAEKGRDRSRVLADVAQMRDRLAAAKPGGGAWEAKFGPGRMMDIELMAQTAALLSASPARQVERQIAAGGKGGILSQPDQTILSEAYRLMWRLQCATKALSGQTADPDTLGQGGRAFVLRETGATDATGLTARLQALAVAAQTVIAARLEDGNGETRDGTVTG
jgi:glutamate-ammonia-ligase adenylyltransferase